MDADETISADLRGARFDGADLTGARLRRVHLNDAEFRMVDLTGARLRDVSLSGAEIEGEIDGLRVNGVEVAPLIEAELSAAWVAIRQSWAAAYERVATMPAGTADVSVAGEWSFTETLRHLVFATDAWLGAVLGSERPFHPWGLAFTEVAEFVERPDELGLDAAAAPTYAEVLELRASRAAQVADFLAEVTPERLAEDVEGPAWEHGRRLSVLRCVWVILNEECEHLRFALRDLDAQAALSVPAGA